jgi:ABC-type transport system involved in multi-copper enzyme maturation permease subunit
MQLGYLRLDSQSLGIALGLGVAIVVGLLVLRRVLGWILGPIFVYETTRLARKGHTFWLRCLFALAVLGMLYVSAPKVKVLSIPTAETRRALAETPIQLDNPYLEQVLGGLYVMQQFAAEFRQTFLLVVAALAISITPYYLGSAISEEKEKRSMDLLLATHVTNYEIVMGKFAARMLNLVGVVLAALPILAITQIWGGVDLRQLAEGLIAIFVSALGYASVGMLCSVLFRRTRDAVIAAYLAIFLLSLTIAAWGAFGSLSPIGYVLEMQSFDSPGTNFATGWGRMKACLALNGGLMAGSLSISVSVVRSLALRRGTYQRPLVVLDRRNDGKRLVLPIHPLAVKDNPPIGDDPLVWKERYLGRTLGGWALNSTYWIYLYFIFIVLGVGAFIVAFNGWQDLLHESLFSRHLRGAWVAMAAAFALVLGLRMATAISREREQLTLVSLLTLPLQPAQILRAKWLGALLRSQWAILGLVMLMVIAGLWNGMPGPSWLLLPMAFAAHMWFIGNLGLFLSVVCASTNRAMSLLIVLILGFMISTWTMTYFAERASQRHRRERALAAERFGGGALGNNASPASSIEQFLKPDWIDGYANPIQVWWRLTGHSYAEDEYWDDRTTHPRLHFLAAVAYAVAGCGLYEFAWLRFRKEGSRG